ncbi:MAG: prepilin-type N-terminal cleavage/methylation domain-containing protein [Patescibacteria group bacterium]|nr:prepilin-type N-terminal cleavage/methylation domain-containing protein [Patescibacteria group bacterium]MDE2438108.1 prepilin-type N-terminal cleavage/methylation domain-containing protein [Patescibacteria group bacterium]
MNKKRTPSRELGFTLVELLLVMTITLTLTTMAIGYSRVGNDSLYLQQSVQKVLTDLNQAASYALSSPARSDGGRYCGFGLHFSGDHYLFYGAVPPSAGCAGTRSYDTTPGSRDHVFYTTMLNHSSIQRVIAGGTAAHDIFFLPPDPAVYVDGATTTTPVEIVVQSERGVTTSVCVNQIGRATLKTSASCS